ncbi:unnamed protein product [Amoebophrya sp. A25]|nr:unnamed protein product [Amoebophrya sp. A25]|eukprot:GSA25T00012281001.1
MWQNSGVFTLRAVDLASFFILTSILTTFSAIVNFFSRATYLLHKTQF